MLGAALGFVGSPNIHPLLETLRSIFEAADITVGILSELGRLHDARHLLLFLHNDVHVLRAQLTVWTLNFKIFLLMFTHGVRYFEARFVRNAAFAFKFIPASFG